MRISILTFGFTKVVHNFLVNLPLTGYRHNSILIKLTFYNVERCGSFMIFFVELGREDKSENHFKARKPKPGSSEYLSYFFHEFLILIKNTLTVLPHFSLGIIYRMDSSVSDLNSESLPQQQKMNQVSKISPLAH